MLKKTLILIFVPLWLFAQNTHELKWEKKELKGFDLYFTHPDKGLVKDMETYLSNGERTVSAFFKTAFKQKVSVYIFPNRSSLDKQWQSAWGDTTFTSQCWMVAAGVAQRMDVLSPNAWGKEACEHNGSDKDEIQKIITHELTHCYHGQFNPSPDFSAAEDMDWFIEGLAVYASGQFDEKRMAQVKSLTEQNKLPAELKKVWKGNAKYAVAGSLIGYIDKTYGRKTLTGLLAFTQTQKALEYLKTREDELISGWKASLAK